MSTLATVLARGTRASQAAATAVPIGSQYCVTDEGDRIERSTGAAWQLVSEGGLTIVKSADESVANNTLQDDNELLFTVAANTIWVVEWTLWAINAADTAGIKTAFTMPALATFSAIQYVFGAVATVLNSGQRYQNTTPTTAQGGGVFAATTQGSPVCGKALIRIGANAGTVTLQWAQNVTDAGNVTTVKKDSYLTYRRVG